MGRVTMVCSICAADVHCSEEQNPKNRHVRIECGTWDNLVAEVERAHRLNPERLDTALRSFIRAIDKAEGGVMVVVLPKRDGSKLTSDEVRAALLKIAAQSSDGDMSVPSGERDSM